MDGVAAFCRYFAVFVVLLTSTASAQSRTSGCPLKADVAFIVDYSNSIWPPYIQTQLQFVVNVTSHLNVGRDGSHVGLISFSDGARAEIRLDQYTDVSRLRAGILGVRQSQHAKTDTFDALRLAREQLFSPVNGARSNVPHIIIIITDGVSSDRRRTVTESNLLRDKGVKVMVVGIGHYLVQEELEEMATAKTSTYVHQVTDFTSLSAALPNIISSTCQVFSDTAGRPTAMLPAEPTHNGKMDVVFVLDKSSSTSSGHFRTQLNFVRDIVNTFNVHRDYTRVSVVTFDNDAKIEFGLTQYYSKSDLSNAILRITYTGGRTISTFRALELVTSRVLTQRGGARMKAARVVIVITGGTSYHKVATQSAAYNLKWSGTYVFAIGVGGSVDKTELNHIGSQPWSNFVFNVAAFTSLHTIKDQLSGRVRQISSGDSLVFRDDKKADVVFVVDKSAGVTANDFRSQLSYVSRVTNMFNVQRDGTHVSVVTFDNEAKMEFGLTAYYTSSRLSAAIQRIPYTGGSSRNTFRALQLVTSRVLTRVGGAREGVAKVVIVLSGGTSHNETETKHWAYQLKWTGAYVFVIGVGRLSETEMNDVATHPSRQFVLRMDNYPVLANSKDLQAIRAREVLTTDLAVFRDDRKMDVVFVVDRSASVTASQFQTQLSFVSNVINSLYVHRDYAHVSVVTFDDDAKVEFRLVDYNSNSYVLSAIRSIAYTGRSTGNTFRALEVVTLSVLNQGGGARQGVPRTVIVISGGTSRNATATLYWSYQLKWTGAYVFAVGVGSDVSMAEMDVVGSAPSGYFVLDVDSYTHLTDFRNQLIIRAREVPSERHFASSGNIPLPPAVHQPVTPAPQPVAPADQPASGSQGGFGCPLKADVVFIVDYSNSIWPPYIQTQLQFVVNVTSHLNVGRDGSHVGVVTFSDGAQPQISLNRYTDTARLQQAILAINQRQNGKTDTFDALRLAREQLFSPVNGARSNVPHIIIIITDGVSSDRRRTVTEANLLREKGIQVMVVGIGHYLVQEELEEMATAKTSTYVHKVTEFTTLNAALPNIIRSTCTVSDESKPPITAAPSTKATTVAVADDTKADVVFVLDRSVSLTSGQFRTQLTFVRDLVNTFNVHRDHTHVSVVTFDNDAKIEFGLTEYYTKSELNNAILRIAYTGGSPISTFRALELVTSRVLTRRGGAREGVARVVIVITGGTSYHKVATQSAAYYLKWSGTYVFAIGVGGSVDKTELNHIGSQPWSNFVFNVPAFPSLHTIKDDLSFKAREVSADLLSITFPDDKKADVVFVVDKSSDVTATHFRSQLNFVYRVTNMFNVQRDGTHVSVVTFDSDAKLEFGLKDYYSKSQLSGAIQRIVYTGRPAVNTFRALELVTTRVLTPMGGAREGVAKVVIVITGGTSHNETATKYWAYQLKWTTGAYVFAVGVGRSVNEVEINHIGTHPSRQFVLRMDSYLALANFKDVQAIRAREVLSTELTVFRDDRKMDVVFVVDRSASVTASQFQTQLSFVSNVINTFYVHRDYTHVSVVTFDDDAKVEFGLLQYYSSSELMNAIRRIPYTGGPTADTFRALELVTTRVLTPGGGAREGVPRLVIVVSGGTSRNVTATLYWAYQLKWTGAYVFAVGVSSGVDPVEMTTIGSQPSSYFTTEVQGYNVLYNTRNPLNLKIREVPPEDIRVLSPNQPAPIVSGCQTNMDVVFIVDYSTSIHPRYIGTELQFVASVLSQLGVGRDGTHVGLITFSEGAHVELLLKDTRDLASLKDAVMTISRKQRPRTDTFAALRLAREQLFSPANGARSDVPHIIIIVTDGVSSDRRRTMTEANLLRDKGIQVLVVGIGHYLDKAELAEMATVNSPTYMHTVYNFTTLTDSFPSLVGSTCKVATENQPDKGNPDACSSDPCQNGGTCVDQVNGYECLCAPGYKGLQCQTDIDECESSPCENGGTCKDAVNGYQCRCLPGYTGLRCQTDIDECADDPCLNGGTCADKVNGYLCHCVPGYTSQKCETDVDECESKPCQNGGTCQDGVNSYTCECAPGFEGVNCEKDVNECEDDPCQNGGTCIDEINGYRCQCAPGYKDQKCQTDVDECASNPCLNGGTCQDKVNGYLCQCVPGYTGLQCQTDINECASRPCQNGGTCIDDVNSYTCLCAPGFSGVNCDKNIDECESHPCQNGGTCKDGINGYLCHCPHGYTDLQCQTDTDDCEGVTCQNGGTCKDGVNSYKCQCAPGFKGLHCQTDIDDCASNPCQNGGTCKDGVDSYTCLCAPGYSGVNCNGDVDECAGDPCENGGTCIDKVNGYTCLCVPGYKDLRCQTDINDCENKPCQNGGTCQDGVNSYSCSCAPGFTGFNCSTDIDECESSPCQNGGTCKDGVNGYKCQCAPGFTGLHCETDINECVSRPCQNGGKCKDGVNSYTCLCAPGYSGANCDKDIDECESDPCQNGGTCKDGVNGYTCECAPGYTGLRCQTDIDDCEKKPCQNGGTCKDGVNSYTCHCAPGFTGVNCDEDIDDCESKPCQNGATCKDGVDSYTCVCAVGYSGVNCNKDIDDCEGVTCQNGGTCKDGVNSYKCQCAPGYTDVHCETDIDDCESKPCQNGATCQDGVDSYSCQCAPGYAGVNCDKDINECESDPCQNGGTCIDEVNGYKCHCASGYKDHRCQTDIDDCESKPCQNGGTCKDGVDSYTCTCAPGFTGVNCDKDIDECESDPCQNGGTCKDGVNGYTCECAPGYTDLQCQTDIDDCESKPCQNKGTCKDGVNSYTCLCAPGYSGVNCDENIDDCVGAPCQNGGTCKDGVNSYKCQCAPGYTDGHCETDIDDCASNPCQNGGTCKDGVDSFTCLCAPGYAGVSCNGDVDECKGDPCQNGGTCIDEVNGYRCQCAPGFKDLRCQTDIDDCEKKPCENGGTCEDGVDSYTCLCAPGFTGVNCSTDVNECKSAPCQNGATCTDEVNGYSCQCAPGYTDVRCQTDIDDCEKKPCQNGGTCKDGVNSYICHCAPGFTGVNCDEDIDDCEGATCQNGGTCKDGVNSYKCQCAPGYTDQHCETDIDDCATNPCQNGGTCKDGVDSYTCVCAPGYAGVNCVEDVDECEGDPCENGGTCIDEVNGYKCQCAPGFKDHRCQTDIDDCEKKPCQNGGTCKDGVNSYTCACAPGFTGVNCSTDIDDCEGVTCQNGGTCKDGVNSYKCQCAPGYTGAHCETDIDDCEKKPCQNGGTCKDGVNSYTCHCAPGFTGVSCDKDIDECESSPCQNGGTCKDGVNGYKCQCAPGYTGQHCQTDINECESSPCQNGGTCVDGVDSYTCACASGYSGVNCDGDVNECENDPCLNGGTCIDEVNGYRCQCAPGYKDLRCQTDIDDCEKKPCQNGGTCKDGVNSYTCHCAQGFTGVNCDTDIDECESSPCQNGGTCKDAVNGYKCQCAPGYTGQHCQTDIDDCASKPCQNGGTCKDGVNSYTCLCTQDYAGVNCEEAPPKDQPAPPGKPGPCHLTKVPADVVFVTDLMYAQPDDVKRTTDLMTEVAGSILEESDVHRFGLVSSRCRRLISSSSTSPAGQKKEGHLVEIISRAMEIMTTEHTAPTPRKNATTTKRLAVVFVHGPISDVDTATKLVREAEAKSSSTSGGVPSSTQFVFVGIGSTAEKQQLLQLSSAPNSASLLMDTKGGKNKVTPQDIRTKICEGLAK